MQEVVNWVFPKNVAQLAKLTQFALVCFKLHMVDKFMLQNVKQLLIVIN